MTQKIQDFLRTRRDEGPCLVVDLDVVRDNYRLFEKALPDSRVFYAVKANPDAAVLNLLAQLIRGKRVDVALADLEFSQKRIALDVRKTLESAIANAENNHQLDVDDLVVAEAHVGKALVMKRFSPRARGRAGRINKPFANLTIVVREVEATQAA